MNMSKLSIYANKKYNDLKKKKKAYNWNMRTITQWYTTPILYNDIQLLSYLSWKICSKNISGFRRNLECTQSCFFKYSKYSFFVALLLTTQLLKQLQHWVLCEVIEVILPFVLNTKRPLSNIWLLRYRQKSFGCFRKKFRS